MLRMCKRSPRSLMYNQLYGTRQALHVKNKEVRGKRVLLSEPSAWFPLFVGSLFHRIYIFAEDTYSMIRQNMQPISCNSSNVPWIARPIVGLFNI
uniref:Putative ribonuclease H protein At1g65750 family n=1 Tax=Rhizophora mucronata TaxID=61149 RepID=A0A2P2QN76_RHIMU